VDTIAVEALQGLTTAVGSLLPVPADPALAAAVSLGSVRISPTGVGSHIGTNDDPAGEIVGRRVEAAVVLGVRASTDDELPAAVGAVTTALLAADRASLRQLGILRVSLESVAPPASPQQGLREVSVNVLYEYVKPPTGPEGLIAEVPLEMEVDTTGRLRSVFSAVPFDAGDFASFDPIDDPKATNNAPSAWSFDATDGAVHQGSRIFGGSTTPNANKPGSYLVLRTTPATPALADVIVRSELRSDGDRGIGVVFRFVDVDNFYFFLMEANGTYRRIGRKVGGTFGELDTPAVDLTVGYVPGRTVRLRVQARGDALTASIDERQILTGRDGSIAGPGRVGLMTKGNDKASFGSLEVLEV
jgi:hypothetical protein